MSSSEEMAFSPIWDYSSSGPWVEAGDLQHLVPDPHVYHQEQHFTPSTQGQVYTNLPDQPYYASWDSSNSGPCIESGDFQHVVPDPHVYQQEQDFTPSTQGQVYYSLPAQPYYASWDSSNSGPWVEAGDIQHLVPAPHVYHLEQQLTPSTQGQVYYILPAQPYYPSWDTISCSGPCVEAGDLPHPIPSSHVYHQEQIFTPSAQGQQRELPGMAEVSEDQCCSFMAAGEYPVEGLYGPAEIPPVQEQVLPPLDKQEHTLNNWGPSRRHQGHRSTDPSSQ